MAKEEVDSRIMTDSSEKNIKLRDAPTTFQSKVSTYFSFYIITRRNKMSALMCVMSAFCVLQLNTMMYYYMIILQYIDYPIIAVS